MVRYEFPWPPKELSPNARVHWRALAHAKREYRDLCGFTVLAKGDGGVRLISPITAQVTFVVPDKRRRDTDNHMAMLKPMWDALVAVGVFIDDSHDKLRILTPKWERGEKKVIVELEAHDEMS